MIAGVLGGAALLLVVAGAAKVVDPSRTVGALRAVGWPAGGLLVRVGAGVELVLGAGALVWSARPLGMMVGASYLGFAVFVLGALRAGAPVGTCGCFGQADTPPRASHVVVDALLAAGAIGAAVSGAPALLDASWGSWVVAVLVALVSYGLLVGPPPERSRRGDDRRASGRA